QRAAVAAGAVAAVLAVGGLAVATHGSNSHPEPAPSAPTTTPSPTTAAVAAGPLGGTWHTPKIDRQRGRSSLEAARVKPTADADTVTGLPAGEFRYRLLISRGMLQARINHGPLVFSVFVSVDGDSLTMTPGRAAPGEHWTYDWHQDGDRLTLELRGST